ncbi:quinone-dependent dihydroorotate dehydrogenase [Novosphingopyxis iocasae]|uniref:quinone-dependent dihydroorotate dehydrogenase n=1 Tax=Novosphingopyxis iocasae TaxID=2762729 RepID=UPI001651227A|nr:quinone-dependent dihydroorotate dehydrogenase [Novosphingopyxis iocasae]
MWFKSFARPVLFQIEPERAHRLTIEMLKRKPRTAGPVEDAVLACEVAGLIFPNPVGLAAGVDKDAEAPLSFLDLGFGFAEVGTITPLPQEGNPRPRIFRLEEDRAIVNRLGFNNGGQAAAAKRLKLYARRPGPIGVNIGANKDSPDRIADYARGAAAMCPYADYLTVNVSSPNTPGLRALQDKAMLSALLAAVIENNHHACPVFLKVAPDLEPADIEDIAEVAIDQGVAALIISNTTITRPLLHSTKASESGGLSGAPLAELSAARLTDFRRICGNRLPLIAVGGIASGADAYARIRAGASLVQLYTALIYEGPGLGRRIANDLAALLKRDGFENVRDAVGIDVG